MRSLRLKILLRAIARDPEAFSAATQVFSGALGKTAPRNEKAGVPSRFKRNYVRCANSVTAFQFLRLRQYINPTTPSAISANVTGSGTAGLV